MAEKIIYEVVLEETWKSNLGRKGKFPAEGKYNVASNKGAQFAIMKAKSFALKRREKGVRGIEDKEFDESCIAAELKSVNPVLTVDC
jgi:hypothetical protein